MKAKDKPVGTMIRPGGSAVLPPPPVRVMLTPDPRDEREIATLRAEVERLTRERDELVKMVAEARAATDDRLADALARVGVLEAAARVAEFDLRSIRMDLSDMTQVSRVQRVMDRLRVALAPGKGEP